MIALAAFKTFAGRVLLPVLTFGLTVPLWLILAAALWVHFDRSSAVRQAVDRAVTELVAGAELDAAKARLEAMRRLHAMALGAAEEARRRAQAAEDANRAFAADLAASDAIREEIANDLEELLARPVDAACAVSPGLLDRLRNR